MALTFTLVDTWDDGLRMHVSGTVTASGNHAAGGDTLDLSQVGIPARSATPLMVSKSAASGGGALHQKSAQQVVTSHAAFNYGMAAATPITPRKSSLTSRTTNDLDAFRSAPSSFASLRSHSVAPRTPRSPSTQLRQLWGFGLIRAVFTSPTPSFKSQ